jgi:hypothetical protein
MKKWKPLLIFHYIQTAMRLYLLIWHCTQAIQYVPSRQNLTFALLRIWSMSEIWQSFTLVVNTPLSFPYTIKQYIKSILILYSFLLYHTISHFTLFSFSSHNLSKPQIFIYELMPQHNVWHWHATKQKYSIHKEVYVTKQPAWYWSIVLDFVSIYLSICLQAEACSCVVQNITCFQP